MFEVRKPINWRYSLRRLVVGVVAVLICLVLYFFILPHTELGGLSGLQPPFFSLRSRYERIIKASKSGVLRPDSKGNISLKGSFEGITKNDLVIFEKRADGREFYIFPVWFGRAGDLQGYMYVTPPLQKSDYRISSGRPVIDVGYVIELTVVDEGDGWSWVWTRMG